jgi:hypothetical protein
LYDDIFEPLQLRSDLQRPPVLGRKSNSLVDHDGSWVEPPVLLRDIDLVLHGEWDRGPGGVNDSHAESTDTGTAVDDARLRADIAGAFFSFHASLNQGRLIDERCVLSHVCIETKSNAFS